MLHVHTECYRIKTGMMTTLIVIKMNTNTTDVALTPLIESVSGV